MVETSIFGVLAYKMDFEISILQILDVALKSLLSSSSGIFSDEFY